MKLQVPDNLNGIVLIDIIKQLYTEYCENYQNDDNDWETINNLSDRVSNCRYHPVNNYLENLLQFVMLDRNSKATLTRDDLSYGVTMIQILKGAPVLIDFISLMTNIDILSWEYSYTSKGIKLKIVIDRLETQQVKFVVDQFRKSILSLLLVSELEIVINNIISLVYSEGEAITSKPVIELSSKYNFTFSSITELINGTN